MPLLEKSIFLLALCAALGSGLMGGIFFAFSNFIMRGLERLPARESIAAMQSINVTVLNPLFLALFFGLALLSAALALFAHCRWQHPSAIYLLAGGLLYLIGCFAITALGNVPLNESLSRIDPSAADAAALWRTYSSRWGMWNLLRTIACVLSASAFILAATASVSA